MMNDDVYILWLFHIFKFVVHMRNNLVLGVVTISSSQLKNK